MLEESLASVTEMLKKQRENGDKVESQVEAKLRARQALLAIEARQGKPALTESIVKNESQSAS